MFLLRQRATSVTDLAAAAIKDAANVDLSGASEAGLRRRRTDQALSDKRPSSQPGQRQVRHLSENEKARISIYLRILNAIIAATFAVVYVAKDRSIILFEIICAKGLNDILYLISAVVVTSTLVTASVALYAIVLLHQTLVSVLSPLLLVNATFFTLHPYPPISPSFRAMRRRISKIDLTSATNYGVRYSSSATSNALQMDTSPLIDLSSRSSEPGDTPPALPSVLMPEVLSPTQLQLRSLSPAFSASLQQIKESDVEEILQSSSRPAMSSGLSAILSKRNDLAPLMFGRLPPAERSMSTVSYPDILGGSGVSEDDEEEDKLMEDNVYQSEQDTEERESPLNVAHIDTDGDFDDDEDGDDMHFPLPDVQPGDIPFTSSPSHIALTVAPEAIDVLDPESRQASMDSAAPAGMVMPVPHPSSFGSNQAQIPFTPPHSRVAIMTQAPSDAVDSPRDIFSPTPVSFPQPVNGLPFAFPFLREQLQQRLSSPPTASISQWNHEVARTDKKDEADENITEPTPYPSPPFTPPSSRPPTMYSSMALQIPPRDLAPEMLSTPDPFIVDRSPLSALVEDAKAESDLEGSAPVVEAPHSVAAEPDHTEPDVASAETLSVPIYEAATSTEQFDHTQAPPSYSEDAPSNEILMPTATRGILRNPLSHVVQADNAPPRTISPVKSIGRGGLFDGSRIDVEDVAGDSSIVSAADTERTLVASSAEESFNEVGSVVAQDAECAVADVDGECNSHRHRSGATSGADDESTAPKAKADLKKKKKKTKKIKKGVSFDEVPFVIGSDLEQDDDGTDTVLNDIAPSARPTSPLALPSIPVPKTFEIEEEEDAIPELISPNVSSQGFQGSPAPNRSVSLLSEVMSPRSTTDDMSDSSSVLPPGQFSPKQVDHYGRWFARAHRDKSLPTIQVLRDQMKACSDVELAGRLRLGSRSDPTKLSKTLVGEDNMKGVGANGSLPPPPVRKGSSYRRRR